jgi:hypothetical protein
MGYVSLAVSNFPVCTVRVQQSDTHSNSPFFNRTHLYPSMKKWKETFQLWNRVSMWSWTISHR